MKNIKIKNLTKVLMVIVMLSVTSVSANVGKVVYGYGNNHAFDSDGNRRELTRGSEIKEGDTLVTGRGRMHIRLIDGGFVSVYPNSEYRIDKFKFSGKKVNAKSSTTVSAKKVKPRSESKNDRGFFSLLKGAARQVTGLLGRTYNENFKFKTSVATIGIRGTGFFAKLCQADCFDADGNPMPDGMYVKNNTGVITMTTNAGEVALAQGQSAHASSSEDSPRQVDQPPIAYNYVTPDIELYDFDEKVVDTKVAELAEVVDPVVTPPVASTIIPTKVDYVFNSSTTFGSVNSLDTSNPLDSTQQNGDVIEHFETTIMGDGVGLPVIFDKATATLAENGSDTNFGILWERWNGRYTYTEGGGAIASLDSNIHIIGAEQLTQNVTSLGSKGTVQYIGTGGTSPTMLTSMGNKLVGTQTVTVGLDFANVASGQVFVTAFNVQADFGAAAVVDINPLSFPSITGNNGTFDIQGTCNGTECGGTAVGMSGFTTINLVGDQAQGVFGAYNLGGRGNAVSGSYVAEEGAAVAVGL